MAVPPPSERNNALTEEFSVISRYDAAAGHGIEELLDVIKSDFEALLICLLHLVVRDDTVAYQSELTTTVVALDTVMHPAADFGTLTDCVGCRSYPRLVWLHIVDDKSLVWVRLRCFDSGLGDISREDGTEIIFPFAEHAFYGVKDIVGEILGIWVCCHVHRIVKVTALKVLLHELPTPGTF